MFLFVSKLLPLFLYPLGLISILMVVAFFNIWKRPRLAASCIAIAFVVLLATSNAWAAKYLIKSLEWQNISTSPLPKAEAIVVLGGATKSKFPPRPSADLSEQGDRVIYAAQLWRQQLAPIIILSGGRIDWRGGGESESKDMAAILTSLGIPSSAIVEEPDSLNTYQNAANVKKILQKRGIKQVLLVTSAMHMPRSLSIFTKQGIKAIAAPTDYLVSEGELSELANSPKAAILNIVPDVGNLEQFTLALKEYIGMIIYRLRGWL